MNQQALTALLQRLDSAFGPSGFEEDIGLIFAEEMSGWCDEHRTDKLGSHLFWRKGEADAPVILLTADMDEPGFMLSSITSSGTLLLLPIGPPAPQPLQNQGYTLYTSQGMLPAVCGPQPAGQELPNGPLLALDVGARSRRAAENRGIAIGDPAVSSRRGESIGKSLFSGRSMAARSGCAALICTMRLLKRAAAPANIVACAAVQGRLGKRGMLAAAQALSPQLVLSFGAAGSGAPLLQPSSRLGEGPVIRAYGGMLPGNLLPRFLRCRLEAAARLHHIPWQLEVTAPSAAAGGPPPAGLSVPVVEIGIPCRYENTPVCLVDTGDILNAARLAAAFLEAPEAL